MVRGGAGQYNANRLFADYDTDLLAAGKKNDDRRPPNAGVAATWTGNFFRLRSRRRVFVILCALFAAWLFIRGLPADFWEPSDMGAQRIAQFHSGTSSAGSRPNGYPGPRPGERFGGGGARQEKAVDAAGAPPTPKGWRRNEDMHYYDGEILFPELTSTLHSIQRTMGFRKVNLNVLFAASSLKSLATIIPLACEMTRRENSIVHVTVFGRSELDLEEILKINGIDKKECKAYWHDARPNWAEYSSDFRAEASVASALEHIYEFMHPQAIIMDDSSLEDMWFTRQIRVKAAKLDWPVIELPAGSSERLHWLSRLDAQALKTFHKTSVDILVQAPKGEAGGLMRLMKSLKEADYHGLPAPRLTIELPDEVDSMTSWFLSGYRWPPPASPLQPVLSSQLNIRHRIPGQSLGPEEASIRFLESFYPSSAEHSHVLVLNTNAELSPQYYHWVMYYILHYKQSRAGSLLSQHLVGMSLVLPTTYLNGTTDFNPPTPDASSTSPEWPGHASPRHSDTRPPFLWQAPDSNAALYFGDKWAEIHDFLKHRIRLTKEGKKSKNRKVIGEHLPAWTEHFLEIMRARGWSMLYPPSSQRAIATATVHTELWEPPEEFADEYRKVKKAEPDTEELVEAPILADDKAPLRAEEAHWRQSERILTQTGQSLHAILPFQGEEPSLKSLPHLLFDGTSVQLSDLGALTDEYVEDFRKKTGGCVIDHKGTRKVVPGKTGDLFCWGDEDESEWEKEEKPSFGEGTAKGG